jgi:hypothetical protein
MGIFRKIGGGIKRLTQKAATAVKKGVKKYGPKILSIGQAGLGILSKVPGTVGTISQKVNDGINTVKNIISKVPNQKAQDKLNSFADKIQEKTHEMHTRILPIHEKITPMARDAINVISKVPGVT